MSPDILCLSHLRWDHVYQRPNHLMARAARQARVFFLEEPAYDVDDPCLERFVRDGVDVVVPHISPDRPTAPQMRWAVDTLMARERIREPILWYYTPLALPWTRHLHTTASLRVYDCMDHLAGFAGAPPGLLALERSLLAETDVLFTGGASLHEAKAGTHRDAHCFPSSVDVAHFRRARDAVSDPADQAHLERPRVGYFGVLDERIDWTLLRAVIDGRPDLQFVLVGPTAKIESHVLPTAPNAHLLGQRPYEELPAYLGGWDVAIMPFARNEATRHISPTKTPEYLAGGRPVVSTSIRDVVRPYGLAGLVHIADDPVAFSAALDVALAQDPVAHVARADRLLAESSWDRTWASMADRVKHAVQRRRRIGRRNPAAQRSIPITTGIAPAVLAPSRNPASTVGTLPVASVATSGRGAEG